MMTKASEAQEAAGWPPARDKCGRFASGSSGNPYGRPRKRRAPPWSLEDSFAAALAEVVAVAGADGSSQLLEMRELLIKSVVRGAVKAKPKDQLHILERLMKLNVLSEAAEDEEDEGIFTEEDRRLLEIVRREYIEHNCCQCDKPIHQTSSLPQITGGFGLE
jgi:hypothetical protein